MADERRDSLDQLADTASTVAKILQAAQAGGPAGAAAQTAREFHRQAAAVIAVVLLLPILLIVSLPGVVFGSLMAPSDTILTDELEIAENVITIKNSIAGILQASYEAMLEEIEQDSQGRYTTEVVDEVGGHVTFNALQILSMYCAHMGAEDYDSCTVSLSSCHLARLARVRCVAGRPQFGQTDCRLFLGAVSQTSCWQLVQYACTRLQSVRS